MSVQQPVPQPPPPLPPLVTPVIPPSSCLFNDQSNGTQKCGTAHKTCSFRASYSSGKKLVTLVENTGRCSTQLPESNFLCELVVPNKYSDIVCYCYYEKNCNNFSSPALHKNVRLEAHRLFRTTVDVKYLPLICPPKQDDYPLLGLGIPLIIFGGVFLALLLIGMAYLVMKLCKMRKAETERWKPTRRSNKSLPKPAASNSLNSDDQHRLLGGVTAESSLSLVLSDDEQKNVVAAILKISKTPYNGWHLRWTREVGSIEPAYEKCKIGIKKSNKGRARHKSNRLCIEETRVVFSAEDSKRYLDANWANTEKTIICTSAPLGAGVPDRDDTRADFYLMLLTLDIANIVMACHVDEIAPRDAKFADLIYFPHRTQAQTYKLDDGRYFDVSWKSSEKLHVGVEKSTLQIVMYDKTGKELKRHKVVHYYLCSWPDNLCASAESVDYVLSDLLRRKESTVVHCSAGQGRTGSFTLMLLLIRSILNGGPVDPIALAIQLRRQRFRAIRSPAQFVFALYCAMYTLLKYVQSPTYELYRYLSDFSLQMLKHQAEDARFSERLRVKDDPTSSAELKTKNTQSSALFEMSSRDIIDEKRIEGLETTQEAHSNVTPVMNNTNETNTGN